MHSISSRDSSSAQPDGTCAGCGFVAWCLPADLNASDVRQIEQVTEHRRAIKRNHYLFHAGDALNSLYVVNSGSIKTSMPSEDGRAQLIGFFMPGDIIGMEAICRGKYPSDVIALEDTSSCGIHYADILRLSQVIPALQHHLHRAMSREITRDYDMMFMLGSMRAEERLAAFLLDLSQKYSARGYSALHFRLSMSRQDIGSYLGLKLETISRILTRLHAEQMLEVCGRDITIKNPASLRLMVDGSRLHTAFSPASS